jgi:hypothetical protein
VLLDQEEAKQAWWDETIRRCDEAAKHPERMLSPEAFGKATAEEISRRKTKIAAR